MPLFEYECLECKSRFEQLVLGRDQAVTCRSCGGSDIRQLLSTFSVAASGAKATEPGPCGSCGAAVRGSCSMN